MLYYAILYPNLLCYLCSHNATDSEHEHSFSYNTDNDHSMNTTMPMPAGDLWLDEREHSSW
jgi:hypothetical protein